MQAAFFAHLSGKGGENLQGAASNLGPLALNLTKLISVRYPVKWQNVKLLVFWDVTHRAVVFLG